MKYSLSTLFWLMTLVACALLFHKQLVNVIVFDPVGYLLMVPIAILFAICSARFSIRVPLPRLQIQILVVVLMLSSAYCELIMIRCYSFADQDFPRAFPYPDRLIQGLWKQTQPEQLVQRLVSILALVALGCSAAAGVCLGALFSNVSADTANLESGESDRQS